MITLSRYVKKALVRQFTNTYQGFTTYGTQAPAKTHHVPCCTELYVLFGWLQRLASRPASRSDVDIGKNQGHKNNWSNNHSLFTKAPTKQAIYKNAQHHNKYFNWGRYVSSQQSIHRMNNIASQDALSGNRWTEQVKTRPLLPPPRIDQTISEADTVALPTTHFPKPLLKLAQNLSPNL